MDQNELERRRILLSEQERAAYIAGDTEKANLIAEIMRLDQELDESLETLHLMQI